MVLVTALGGLAGVFWQWRAADRERIKAEKLNQFLIQDMLAAAALKTTPGRKLTVTEVLAKTQRRRSTRRSPTAGDGGVDPPGHWPELYESGPVRRGGGELRRAVALDRQALGPKHRETLVAINRLMKVLAWRHKWSEPDFDFQLALDTCRGVLGPADPETLFAMSNLAWRHKNLGNPAEAARLMQKVLDGRRRVLGPKHRDTLEAMYSLALVPRDVGLARGC